MRGLRGTYDCPMTEDGLDTSLSLPAGLEGLSSADAARRLREVGPNRWVERDRLAALRELASLLFDPMAMMLGVAAVIYYLLGETRDAVVLLVALVPVLGVDVALEARSRAALARLAEAAALLAEVVRDAHIQTIAVEHVVPGDLLVLREGHVVAADAVVEWASNLSLDESSLTGESEPQAKRPWLDDPDRAPADTRVFGGSPVLTGRGFARVTATGAATQYGHIAALVASAPPEPSPLQRRAAALVRRLGLVALAVAGGLFVLALLRGEPWTQGLLDAVSLSMAAIPEEYPIVLALFLSVGAWRLASRGMLVRRLASVETLGSTTVICTDKTGTLTRGRFQVVEHVVLDPRSSAHDLLELAVLACEPDPVDAMEQAIVAYADAQGVRPATVLAGRTLERDHDFDVVGKHMSHVWRGPASGDTVVVAAKGAIEGVLSHGGGDAMARSQALDANTRLAQQGLRVLAVAGKRAAAPGRLREDDERDLVLVGLLGFQDPLRPEVPDAVDQCQRAGILVKMITGDHALTAHAVAHAAGLVHADGDIVTGDDLAALDETARAARIERASIFARIAPAQKFEIVDALKRAGHIVAMTGDGVNDAAALRRADIGIAMGQRGTDVARATADLVLLDDNFASIVWTVREGRHILQNVQRAFLYLVAFHIPVVALTALAPAAGLPLVLLPVHLVWLELIVHQVSALVFQAERASPAVMDAPPRPADAPLLPRAAIRRSVLSGSLLATGAFALYWWQLGPRGADEARALVLITLVAGGQALVAAERVSLGHAGVPFVPRTWTFWIVCLLTALSLVAILAVPALASLFRVAVPEVRHGLTAVAIGVAAVGWRLIGAARPATPGGPPADVRRPGPPAS